MIDYFLKKYCDQQKELCLNPKNKNDIVLSNFIRKLIRLELEKMGDLSVYRTKYFEYDRNYTFVALCNWNYWDHIILLKKIKDFIPKKYWGRLEFHFIEMYFGYCIQVCYIGNRYIK